MTQYFLGKGKLYEADRGADGMPLALRHKGDVSSLKVSIKVTKADHNESETGENTKVKSIIVKKEASVDATLHELTSDNLSSGASGNVTKLPAGTVTGEKLPLNLLAGDRVGLRYPTVSAVTITDSASTPASVSSTKYKVDPKFGAIEFLDVTGFTQPFRVAYSYGALESVSMFSKQMPEKFWRYEGINLAEDGKPVVVELYKVQGDPFKDLPLITDKIADFNVSAEVLRDTARPDDGELGQFGRIIQVAPA